jgi:asparagine synthase (glutamine-hydrolysing)
LSPAFDNDSALQFEPAVEELRALAADSVERRMISEVPLGGFLSGGVDSSAVVALMSSRPERRVKSFSIGFTDKDFDEVQYARMVADRYATNHHELVTPLGRGDAADTGRAV